MDPIRLNQAAKVLRALAHPVRLGVLQSLAGGEKTVTELYTELGCSQSMMSQQLGILETQGLVQTRKAGVQKYCTLGNSEFLHLLDCLDQHLARTPGAVSATATPASGRATRRKS